MQPRHFRQRLLELAAEYELLHAERPRRFSGGSLEAAPARSRSGKALSFAELPEALPEAPAELAEAPILTSVDGALPPSWGSDGEGAQPPGEGAQRLRERPTSPRATADGEGARARVLSGASVVSDEQPRVGTPAQSRIGVRCCLRPRPRR
ncbi:unnamed protein product [Prorocentrum cordatum]|uniref:Uncharacterized protein n=1 Tax=Prorocentrum cordatum TaxID=2364126 RepID=A0ABN9X4U3_9DINO|nr:unnamed protein product [Polarella glacialis]